MSAHAPSHRPSAVRRLGATAGAVAAAAAMLVAAAPAASAYGTFRDVQMPYPYGGVHHMVFDGGVGCAYSGPDDARVGQPVLSAGAVDKGVHFNGTLFDLHDFIHHNIPFNTTTVSWRNVQTGAEGSVTTSTTGATMGAKEIPVGHGDIDVSIRVVRSALPSLAPGSVVPFGTVEHTEAFRVSGVQPVPCR